MARLEYSVADDFHALMELYPTWERAFEETSSHHTPMNSPEWFHAAWFQYRAAPRARARALAVWSGGALAAVFPFIERPGGLVPRLVALSEIAPVFCCADEDEVLRFLWSTLARLYGDFHLDLPQVELSLPPVARALASAERVLWRVDRHKTHDNVIVDLRAGWSAASARLSRNTREGIRKATARIRDDATSHCVRCYRTPQEIGEGIDRLLAIDALSWKRGMGGAMCESEGEDVLYKCVLERFAAKDRVRVFTLDIEGQPASFIIALRAGRTAYFCIWTYADYLGYFMPGKVLMSHALQSCADEGIERVDFWGRWDRFKASWSRDSVPRYLVRVRHHRAASARVLVELAEEIEAHPLTERVRRFIRGDPERYRWKTFVPSPVEKHLVHPLREWMNAARARMEYRKHSLRAEDRSGAKGVSLRPMALVDKRLWVGNHARTEAHTSVCERDGRPIGFVRLRPLGSEACALVELFVVLTGDARDAHDCARATLRSFGAITCLYETPARAARRGEASMIDALTGRIDGNEGEAQA